MNDDKWFWIAAMCGMVCYTVWMIVPVAGGK